MTGAIAHDQAQFLRAALDRILGESGDTLVASETARDAFLRLVDVLESSPEAVVLPSDALVSTQKAADLGSIMMTYPVLDCFSRWKAPSTV
jgi:hypothetical protein